MTDLIQRAGDFAEKAHEGQVRKYTGEPYFMHVEAVALMVQNDGGDDAQVAAAYLHDVVEDCDVTFAEVDDSFGLDVAWLVLELTDQFTHEQYPTWNRKRRKEAECGRLGRISDRAKFIKIKDLQDNTSSIVEYDPTFAKVYLLEKAAILEAITKETNMGTLEEEHIATQRKEIQNLKERNDYLDAQLVVKDEHIERIETNDTVELRGTGVVTKMSWEQHAALVAEKVAPLEVRVKELQNELDIAHAADKHLHAQIEALTPDPDEATPCEMETALELAEEARDKMESEIASYEKTVKRLHHEIKGLRNDNADLQQEPVAG